MRPTIRKPLLIAILAGGLAVVFTVAAFAQYTMTVNKDRLINAQNEPQNWLMMNGDYGSTRYSKLSLINRDNIKNLRMVWALALGGMQDVGQNGPENEVNPLIDNGFMYTTDGWGTVYKIDARESSRGQFVWVTDPGVKHGKIRTTRGKPAVAVSGRRAPTIRRQDSPSGALVIRFLNTIRNRARATTCTPTLRWPSTSIPANWSGIFNTRRTIRGTMTK